MLQNFKNSNILNALSLLNMVYMLGIEVSLLSFINEELFVKFQMVINNIDKVW